jgi:ribosomal protein L5
MPKKTKEKDEALLKLKEKLNIKNINSIPRIQKVVVACGI